MKKKIVAFLVCMLVAIGSAFTVGASMSIEKQRSVTQSSNSQQGGTTLITEAGNTRVIEVDSSGNIVWQKTGLNFPIDAERLANGNTLITEFIISQVIEVDTAGMIVWQKTGLNMPYDAERLANGNTLISDVGVNRVIEVDTAGMIVWQKTGLIAPGDAERLGNGNTLIAEPGNNRVIEVDSSGTIVWQIAGLNLPWDVERILLQPDLDCIGYLTWTGVKPGSPATGSFLVENIGDSGSELDWEIKEWPTWGTWTFTPTNGTDLTPEDGTVTIEVTVIAPNEKNQNFTGDVKIVNSEDDSDFCIVPASLSTPKNKETNFNLPLLNWLFERFPNAFPILRYMLGL